MNLNSPIFNNFIPATIWLGFHIFIPSWDISFLSAIIALRAALVGYYFLIRDVPTLRAPLYQSVIAYISTFLPSLIDWNHNSDFANLISEIITTFGVVIFIWAILDLGKSFGISPALRPIKNCGSYKFFKHPIYFSGLLILSGGIISNPQTVNVILGIIGFSLFGTRIYFENCLLKKINLNYNY